MSICLSIFSNFTFFIRNKNYSIDIIFEDAEVLSVLLSGRPDRTKKCPGIIKLKLFFFCKFKYELILNSCKIKNEI